MKSPALRSAPPGSTPSPAAAGATASKRPPRFDDRIERHDGIRARRQRVADVDANRRGSERRRRIGAGVGDVLGADRVAVAQRDRASAGWPAAAATSSASARLSALGQIDGARRDRRDRVLIDASTSASGVSRVMR